MTNKENKKVVNMYMKNIKEYPDDITRVSFEAVILDNTVSGNNVKLTDETLYSTALLKSVKDKPIVVNLEKEDFGDHEMFLEGDELIRKTVPIGVFTEDGYITTQSIDGEDRLVLMGKGVLWKSRFTGAVQYLQDMWNEGITIPMSSEYLYSGSSFDENNVEIHDEDSNVTFEGLCILNKDVVPAYESSTFTMLNSENANTINTLVAQVLNQEKEVVNLEEVIKETEIKEEVEVVEAEVESEVEAEIQANAEEEVIVIQTNEVLPNEISHDDVRIKLNEIVKGNIGEGVNAWVTEVYQTYVIVNEYTYGAEFEYTYDKYFKYDFSGTGANVTVDLESKVEVQSRRQWETVVNTNLEQIENLTMTNAKLTEELNELKPIKEQILNAEKEIMLNSATEKYAKILNAELMETEDVKILISQTITEDESAMQAKLKLADLMINQVSEPKEIKKEAPKTQVNSENLLATLLVQKKEQAERVNLVQGSETDILSELR